MFQLGIFLRALRPARTILRPARTPLRPARLYSALPELFFKKLLFFQYFKKKNYLQKVSVFVFSDSQCKNACKMLADLCPCFHRSPPKLCPDLVSFACWIVTEFWSFTRKCELGHSRSKLCSIMFPNFGCLCARMCPIYFAPCPFPNLAGTLCFTYHREQGVQGKCYSNTGRPPRWESAELVFSQVLGFYEKTNIPTISEHWACMKIIELHDENATLRGIPINRRSAAATTSKLTRVARFIDASIYRDTFPAIRIAILFFTNFESKKKNFFILFFHNDFHLGRKDTCDFCKVIPQIHSYL